MGNSAGEHSHRFVPNERVHTIKTLQKLLVLPRHVVKLPIVFRVAPPGTTGSNNLVSG